MVPLHQCNEIEKYPSWLIVYLLYGGIDAHYYLLLTRKYQSQTTVQIYLYWAAIMHKTCTPLQFMDSYYKMCTPIRAILVK